MEPKIVIIGAGPTGLGAGYRLKELGYKNFQIYDRLPYIGGLASSFTDFWRRINIYWKDFMLKVFYYPAVFRLKKLGATNAIIDANDINRVIELDSPAPISLTLVNITVTNGNSPDGAGIYAGGNHTLALMNSTVSSNVATGANNCGAGIYDVDDGNINIINSTIADNTCTGTGSDGGGIYKGRGTKEMMDISTILTHLGACVSQWRYILKNVPWWCRLMSRPPLDQPDQIRKET